MYLGSCKSASYSASEPFQRAYAGNIVISDLNVSKGQTSIEFLDQLLTDAAQGEIDWGKYKYQKYWKVHRFVLPNNPIAQIGPYLLMD